MPTGSCHCGRVRITIPTAPAYLNECQCTLCFKYGVRWCYFTKDQVTVEIASDSDGDTKQYLLSSPAAASATPLPGLALYIRNDVDYKTKPENTAFNRCANCGGVAFWIRTYPSYAEKPNGRTGINSQLFARDVVEGVEIRKEPGPP
ncbi:glutathione-dependent formaldehyde-activating protein [Ophiostoma piceae UAMH 11346]|uniref:Glutathione-dependent formaldehyde-activating protein n=1 Tax=Ophiostoma piceae (strain UAMH 11346) TaxID=1262450 RepID=S3D6R9_OPHP1|nr:glutathione-dependent formaldehyde-activating protein [Ophiostoma piceae UAMH 11346]